MPNFVLQTPSLQRLAAVKIVTHLWNQPDIITRIATAFHGPPDIKIIDCEPEWEEIEKKVESNVSALSLPEPWEKLLSDVIKPIGMEIVDWCQYHNLDWYPLNFSDKLVPLQFFWTMQGTIDYMKMAALIVRDEKLDVVRRFEVACLNCIEDEALQLIELIPNHRKHMYIHAVVRFASMDRRILVAYFACTLSGSEDVLTRLFQAYMHLPTESLNQYLFKVALLDGSGATCEYFFQKVNHEEKVQVFREWKMPEEPNQEPSTCRLIFLLSHMKEELFGEYTYTDVLECLLRWPMQSLFLEAANRAWQSGNLNSSNCAEVLHDVILKITYGYKDYDYAQSFKELWRSSPAEHKQEFLNDNEYLVNLIGTKRPEFIQLCLNEAPSHQLRELVESRYDEISEELTDERVISDAALMECQERAALESLNDPQDEEKRMRSEHLTRLIDTAMESRIDARN